MTQAAAVSPRAWLRTYYFLRAGVAVAWITAALALGAANPVIGGVLLVLYPTWDAFANALDAQMSGGLRANASQAANVAISLVAALTMAGFGARTGVNGMIAVFGIWAVVAGLLQLSAGVQRWRVAGAQWAMVLSGAQSVAAGVYIFLRSQAGGELSIASVVGYAGFGAFYFLISAAWLTLRRPIGASAA